MPLARLIHRLRLGAREPAGGADLARLPISLDPRAISIAEGARAALSVAALVAANQVLGLPLMMEAALAALLTCLCDSGGPIRRRVPTLLCFGVAGALVTPAMGLAHGAGTAVVLPLAALMIFANSFARIYGMPGQQVGNLLSVVLVLATDAALTSLTRAAMLSVAFLAGSLWALLLTMGLWRIRPYGPARAAVGEAYRRLAVLTADLRELLRRPAAAEDWETHSRSHRGAVRDAIEAARTRVLDTVRVRGPVTGRAAQSLIRIETADQIFAALIGLSELLEPDREPARRAAAARLLRRLVPMLRELSRMISMNTADPGGRFDRAIAAMTADARAIPEAEPARHVLDALLDRLRVAAAMAVPAGALPGTALASEPQPGLREQILGPIRANLAWNSSILRHALRTTVSVTPALAIALAWPGSYSHWLPITMVVTMQPYFALTWTRALERIGGTVLGGILASILGLVLHTPLAVALAIFPLAMIALSVRAVNFGLFITLLTPMVVMLIEVGQPGTSELHIALLRLGFTLAGGALAVLASAALWPSWEPDRLAQEMRTALTAHGAYAATLLDRALGGADGAAVERARAAAGVASNNLEASMQRVLLEPGGTPLEPVMVIDAAMRRMAGRLAALQVESDLARTLGTAAVTAWRDWVPAATGAVALGLPLPPRPEPAPGPAGEALARIARQIELMAGARPRVG